MSSDRSDAQRRTLKPTLALNRTARTPHTPRLAAAAAVTPTSTGSAPKRPVVVKSESQNVTPRIKQPVGRQESTPLKDVPGNITPRSSTRKTRVEGTTSPQSHDGDSPSLPQVRPTLSTSNAPLARGGLSVGVGIQSRTRASRPNSLVSAGGTTRSRSPLAIPLGLGLPPMEESIDSRFFHASDMAKQEALPPPKKQQPKQVPTFFYADGKQEERTQTSPKAPSPVLPAVSDKRTSGLWSRTDPATAGIKSPPLLSPGLSTLSSSSPFFAQASQPNHARPSSPSKENIHLSYRKGASQIFGSRPSPIPSRESDDLSTVAERRGSIETKPLPQTTHIKSPSMSSIDSGNSHKSRRRSATTLDPVTPAPSPLWKSAMMRSRTPRARPPW